MTADAVCLMLCLMPVYDLLICLPAPAPTQVHDLLPNPLLAIALPRQHRGALVGGSTAAVLLHYSVGWQPTCQLSSPSWQPACSC